MYKFPSLPVLKVNEARRDLSRLISRVARGGGAVALGPRGKPAAVLVSVQEYDALRGRAAGRGRGGWQELRLHLVGTADELDAELAAVRRLAARRIVHGTVPSRRRRGGR